MKRFNLKGLWPYTTADGRGKVGCVPQNAKRFIDTAEKLGLTTNESVAFYVSGSDKVGALCKVLDSLDKASVNVKVMDALWASVVGTALTYGLILKKLKALRKR